MQKDVVIALNNLSKRINKLNAVISSTFSKVTGKNADDINLNAGGIEDLAEFADINAGALDDVATTLDEMLAAVDDLATYAASIDERLTTLEERGE